MNASGEALWQHFARCVVDYALIVVDPDNQILAWNTGAERMLGYREEEVLGTSASVLFLPEDLKAGAPEQEIAQALREGRAEDERWYLKKDGTRVRVSGIMTPIRDSSGELLGLGKIMRDVTERELLREQNENALRERTLLLGEVHHRVKNNLQVIVSLLSLQADRITDPEILSSFEETQNRVRAIARIHERLYSTDDLATIHFGAYLATLVSDLRHFYGVTDRITVDTELGDLALDIDQAIPLALISNELVCNAFKHAFPDSVRGRLNVMLKYGDTDAGELDPQVGELRVEDTGVGLPDSVDLQSANSMGFHLVRMLSNQLRATTQLDRTGGTSVRIVFPLAKEPA